MDTGFERELDALRRLVEERLDAFFRGEGLERAMRYSLLAGGKRVRPILCMKFCQAAGGAPEEALDFGCGVEMLHTYSLVHDDLPCMDDDDLRRGKPTCHKVFGECAATLAGDALQAAAFRAVLGAAGPWSADPTAPGRAGLALAEAAGETGMCAGQYWDTLEDGGARDARRLTEINDCKTGALLRAACVMGVLACAGRRKTDPACLAAAAEYALWLGRAFQIRDDVLDVVSTTDQLGKPVGSDRENGKTTYASLLGVEACQRLVLDDTRRAKEALQTAVWPGGTEFLWALADRLARRGA